MTRRSFLLMLVPMLFVACTGPTTPEKEPTPVTSPSPTPSDLGITSCRGLEVPFDREVNTGLDRDAGTLQFSYRKARRDHDITIAYVDDPSCRRNDATRTLIFHVGGGPDILGCIDLPAEPPDGMTRVELWFSDQADPDFIGSSLVVERDSPTTDSIAAATLEAWIDGPTREERRAGALPTAPEGTELLGIDIDGDTATVDLSGDFERTNLGTTGEGQIMNALVGTLTQFDGVDRGLLMTDGEKKDSFMGHGLMVSEKYPLTRPGPKRFRVAPKC